jgi:hypothetical protein
MKTRFYLSDFAENWLKRELPDLNLRRVRMYQCDKFPLEWLITADLSKVSGMTFKRGIYLRNRLFPWKYDDESSMRLLFHEFVHAMQFQRWHFGIPYLFYNWFYSYENDPNEREARDETERLIHRWMHEKPWLSC